MKKGTRNCAVIEIASSNIKMGIFQLSKGKIVTLDRLIYPVTLGHEIFIDKKISANSLNEINSILDKFKAVCKTYDVTSVKLLSTSVMREATNKDVIADRIKILNDLDVITLTDTEEKSLIFWDFLENNSNDNKFNQKAILAYIGSGSIGIACYDGTNIVRSFNITLGTVKLLDMFSGLRKEQTDYHSIIEEYLHSVFSKLKIDYSEYNTLVLTGNEMSNLKNIGEKSALDLYDEMTYTSIRNMYKATKTLTAENIALKYNINEDTASIMSTVLSISTTLIKAVGKSSKIIVAPVDLEKIYAHHILIPSTYNKYKDHIIHSSVESSILLARDYHCNTVHYNTVRKFACQLFDKLKNIHGLDVKYRHLLEVATILHSCGEFVNIRFKFRSAYDLVKNMEIYGITQHQCVLIAIIAGFDETISIENNIDILVELTEEEKISVYKLIAIFKVANALDKSQKGKLIIDRLKIDDKSFVITASCNENASLEQWAFTKCSKYFTEIFGITPSLIVKSRLFK